MAIIIVGCGRVGAQLAYSLFKRGEQVVVIDREAAAFDNLPADFHGRTVEGDALNEGVLRRAGVAQATGLAAVSKSDTLNAVVAHVARDVFHVSNVIVRNYEPRWRHLYATFELPVISPSVWGAERLEEMLCTTAEQSERGQEP